MLHIKPQRHKDNEQQNTPNTPMNSQDLTQEELPSTEPSLALTQDPEPSPTPTDHPNPKLCSTCPSTSLCALLFHRRGLSTP